VPRIAHGRLGLGKLERRTGKREQAQEHLATATTVHREMDMRLWLERPRRSLRDVQEAVRKSRCLETPRTP
jgi:hypothetical protein